ncbi:hypothetical protein [Anatilimnocola floriformis]|uniref:hypothetical protein n=1 Tax=Anatilimnocola floriformis TaxID=2948575 RepID=UPI0020C5A463|nr:hypothetical protein [Anatilimnocola floriformis]
MTGSERTQVGLDGEFSGDVACRLAAQILVASNSTVSIARVFSVDIYRDGGSYGMCFYSPDGEWFEFFVRVQHWDRPTDAIRYHPPVLYFQSVNSRNVIRNFTWEEADELVSGILPEQIVPSMPRVEFGLPEDYERTRFSELVEIIRQRGVRADR